MSVAHVAFPAEPVEEAAPRAIAWRVAAVIGGIGLLALAAVPSAVAVLLLVRPDLFLAQ